MRDAIVVSWYCCVTFMNSYCNNNVVVFVSNDEVFYENTKSKTDAIETKIRADIHHRLNVYFYMNMAYYAYRTYE